MLIGMATIIYNMKMEIFGVERTKSANISKENRRSHEIANIRQTDEGRSYRL